MWEDSYLSFSFDTEVQDVTPGFMAIVDYFPFHTSFTDRLLKNDLFYRRPNLCGRFNFYIWLKYFSVDKHSKVVLCCLNCKMRSENMCEKLA